MPGNIKHSAKPNRPFDSQLKSKRIIWEEEHPIRWSYIKLLRDHSDLKQYYPEINPYVEAYKFRENTWALYSESFDGVGDPWMYVINGPKKALVVDTAFGVGDLKGLVKKLIGDDNKEIIVANTHHHVDHSMGNAQFDKCYCHEDEEFMMRKMMNPHIWDYLYDPETKKGIYSDFDINDIIPYHDYQLCLLKSNECLDLGDGYLVECIPLRGHAAGQSGYLDHQTGCFFIGDVTGSNGPKDWNDPKKENYTVERLQKDFTEAVKRIPEISGVFPGHGLLDQTPTMLQYELDTLNQILANPENYDKVSVMHRPTGDVTVYRKNIYQGTCIRYTPNNVFMSQIADKKEAK